MASFEILEKQGKRRLGKITTEHGDIFTPAFGPDATRGLVKNVAPHELYNLSGNYTAEQIRQITYSNTPRYSEDLLSHNDSANHTIGKSEQTSGNLTQLERRLQNETQFILTNTYHMRSYPGDEFIRDMGGIHQFMNWNLPILTDSGGFQVFSLIHKAKALQGKITDDGAYFRNPINGDKVALTPEIAIDIQFNLGSDIIVALDDPRPPTDHKEMRNSVERTIAWAHRCMARYKKNCITYERSPLIFAVVQGGNDFDLRKYCVEALEKIGFDGYGYGGYPDDGEGNFAYDTLEYLASILPEHKPRYAMGVGTPENMLRCIEMGYDLFDCVIPSRNARHGLCYTSQGEVKIKNAQYKSDKSPLDSELHSIGSQYNKSYLYHLFKINDALGGELLTIHNLKYFNYIMQKPFL